MIRDAFEGEEMARQTSNIMAIFLLVPMVAPSAGAAMLIDRQFDRTLTPLSVAFLVASLLSFAAIRVAARVRRRSLAERLVAVAI